MPTTKDLVIVGASLAGAKAAEGARDAGYDGRITLIGEEPAAPYERPPLSKAVLRGEQEPDAARVHPEGFYADRAVDVVVDRVTGLDVLARRVELRSGDTVPFDTAVLATGAAPRRLEVPGADLTGIHYLRTVDDALRIRDAVRAGGRVAVVGAGWIGSEVAASARQMGAEVVLLDAGPAPLQHVLGDEIAEIFRRLHVDNGVEHVPHAVAAEFRGAGSVEAVVLDDGRVVPADVVVVGVGVVPRTELADAAVGLRVDNGILVDQHLETNVEGVFAVGDVANAWSRRYGRHIRVEHWANALNQGVTGGRNASGARDAYTRLPYFFSDQYDLGMEYVGHAAPGDLVTVRGELEDRKFIAFWHRDGVVTAAMNVNVWDVVDDLKDVVAAGRAVDPGRLADPGVALNELV